MIEKGAREPLEYVEVKYEPNHKELFANRYIRLYRAAIKPGGKTLYHRHTEDTVYIVIRGGVIGTQIAGSNRYPMEFPKSFGIFKKVGWGIRNLLTGYVLMPDGFFFVMRHKSLPVIHRAAASLKNLKEIIMIGIEIKTEAGKLVEIALDRNNFNREFETDHFAVLGLKLKPGESTGFQAYQLPSLVIMCGEAFYETTQGSAAPITRKLTSGEFLWSESEATINISNRGHVDATTYLIMIKE